MTEELKIGTKVWVFDLDHRVYPKSETRWKFGSPIYSEHFRPAEITGETTRSWIVRGGMIGEKRIPKKAPFANTGVYSDSLKDDKIWENQHRNKIIDQLRFCNDVDVLRKIAELIGYEPDGDQ